MIAALLLGLSAAAATPVVPAKAGPNLQDARQAVAAGRLDQAKLMIGKAVAAGTTGPEMDQALADLAYAEGNYSEALVRYQQLLTAAPRDAMLLERIAIAAFKTNDLNRATEFIERATSVPGATWRSWNARGVIADFQHDWIKADAAYEKAWEISPDHAEVATNQGWSRILRGDWTAAITYLERATRIDPASARGRNNLELARAAVSAELPARQPGEDDDAWAARLNDAGVAARLLGDNKRAIAAFSQALEASGTWYRRAANNLHALSSR